MVFNEICEMNIRLLKEKLTGFLPSWRRESLDTVQVQPAAPKTPMLHRISIPKNESEKNMNLAAFSPNMLARLQATTTARKTTPAKPATATATAPKSRPLIVPSSPDMAIAGTCPSCQHDFEVNLKEDIFDGFISCAACEQPGRVADFSLRNVRRTSSPAPAATHRPAAPAARPATSATAPAPAVVYVQGPASNARKYWQVVNGETCEVAPALAEFIGKAPMLGADWKRDVLGVDPNAATRASRAMSDAYAANLRSSQIGGGQR